MTNAIIFVALLLGFVVSYISWKIGPPSKWPAYFSTKTGKGILKGIILAPAIILLIAFILSLLPSKAQAEWFNDASVFAGIDYTKKLSPMCDTNETDDQGTSNMGFRVNVWQHDAVRVNSKYSHHSCVLGSDNKTYDAIGVEVEWQVWKR